LNTGRFRADIRCRRSSLRSIFYRTTNEIKLALAKILEMHEKHNQRCLKIQTTSNVVQSLLSCIIKSTDLASSNVKRWLAVLTTTGNKAKTCMWTIAQENILSRNWWIITFLPLKLLKLLVIKTSNRLTTTRQTNRKNKQTAKLPLSRPIAQRIISVFNEFQSNFKQINIARSVSFCGFRRGNLIFCWINLWYKCRPWTRTMKF
jgi:hypothetical protein